MLEFKNMGLLMKIRFYTLIKNPKLKLDII